MIPFVHLLRRDRQADAAVRAELARYAAERDRLNVTADQLMQLAKETERRP